MNETKRYVIECPDEISQHSLVIIFKEVLFSAKPGDEIEIKDNAKDVLFPNMIIETTLSEVFDILCKMGILREIQEDTNIYTKLVLEDEINPDTILSKLLELSNEEITLKFKFWIKGMNETYSDL